MSGKRLHLCLSVLVVIVFTLAAMTPVWASGTNSFTFLQMQIGSRAQGMGNAFTAIPAHIDGLYYNPASSAFSPRPEMMLYHSSWIEDISIENISFLYPRVNNFAFSAGFSYLHLPEIDEYDISNGNPVRGGTFQIYNLISHVGASFQTGEVFSAGIQIKYLQERIADVVASGVAFDLGILYKLPVEYLSFGMALQNLGPKLKYDEYKEKLPLTYRFGVAYQLPYNPLTFALDVVKISDEDWKFYPGFEFEVLNGLALRAGYQFQKDIGAGYNVGVGFAFLENYSLNYVYSPYGILGNTHRAEFVFNFGSLYHKSSEPRPSSYPMQTSYSSYSSHLPIPKGLTAKQLGDEVILSWDASYIREAKYNIYVEIPGRTGIVKINKEPLTDTNLTFNPTVSSLKLKFYITLVTGNSESEKSEALEFVFRK